MLISHRKRFIYTKTAKTASTSVESYFERYCMPDGEWKFSHGREEYEGETGVIGYRGPDVHRHKWRDHMPAIEIQSEVEPAIWDGYFKFCVIRNPFEKLVSGFYFAEHQRVKRAANSNFRSTITRWFRVVDPIDKVKAEEPVERFREWVRLGGYFNDRNTYTIGDEICIDYFIRYENLLEGIEAVCKKVDVPFEPNRMPRIKGNIRDKTLPVKAFYDSASIQAVKERYAFELEHFGYAEPWLVS